MIDGKKVLAILTARGGSKGLVGKNIKPLHGKPLLAWTIEAGLRSMIVDKLIVSTDDEEIAEVSKRFGAEVPFMRPEYLATDTANSIDVILHACEFFDDHNEKFDLILLLQPTSPLRTAEDIDAAFEYFVAKDADSVVSVCENDHHPWFSNTLPENLSMKDFLRKELHNKYRQALPKTFRVNGAIYIAGIEFLVENKSFLGDGTFAYIMPKLKSVDIDTELDFMLAELILKQEKI